MKKGNKNQPKALQTRWKSSPWPEALRLGWCRMRSHVGTAVTVLGQPRPAGPLVCAASLPHRGGTGCRAWLWWGFTFSFPFMTTVLDIHRLGTS